MPMARLATILLSPGIVVLFLLLVITWYRRVQYPSRLVWGRMLGKVGPVRAHIVLEYNESLEGEEEPATWRARQEERSNQFRVNWGYLRVQTRNTTALLQALRFEQMKIKASKPSLKYQPLETAIVALIADATELRWEQVRWQLKMQLRHRLGFKVNKEVFCALLVHYKGFELNMVALAEAEGKWLHDMLLERLGLTEWRLIEGGQSGPQPV